MPRTATSRTASAKRYSRSKRRRRFICENWNTFYFWTILIFTNLKFKKSKGDFRSLRFTRLDVPSACWRYYAFCLSAHQQLLLGNPFFFALFCAFCRRPSVRPLHEAAAAATCACAHSLNLVILVFPWWLNVTVPRKLDNKPSSSPSSSLASSPWVSFEEPPAEVVAYKVRRSNFYHYIYFSTLHCVCKCSKNISILYKKY